METFLELRRYLDNEIKLLDNETKVAILGDTSTQLLSLGIKAYGIKEKLSLKIFEGDYDQVDGLVFNQESKLYSFNPQITIIFLSSQKLFQKYARLMDKESFVKSNEERIQQLVNTLQGRLNCKIIFFNYCELNDYVFGNYGSSVTSSFIFQLRTLNLSLMKFSATTSDFFICDISSLQNRLGYNFCFDSKLYVNSKMVLSLDFIPYVAKNVIDIVKALKGNVHKCLVLDLDNTLWGGVIGDDGIENIEIGDLGIGQAYTSIQLWAKLLKERGIILTVCSKNNEDTAKEPFEKHPDMVLRLHDIAVFVANWNSKAENIKYIKNVLNIGYDSMVFIDDNPVERDIVRKYLPDVLVVELPDDPADFIEYIKSQNLFETATFSGNDSIRTQQYKEDSLRNAIRMSSSSESEYLSSLEMSASVVKFDKFSVPRVAQLIQRSNQFNLRTIRYSEGDVTKFIDSKTHLGLTYSLKDKFGDNGLISVVILEHMDNSFFIDTWVMSCRVLNRGMEQFVLNSLIDVATTMNKEFIVGEFIETSKNKLVKGLFESLGFLEENGKWHLEISKTRPKKVFISNLNDVL